MDAEERVALLVAAHDRYDQAAAVIYDEALRDVSRGIDESGSAGKADIGALVLWKRIQANTPWARQLNLLPDREIRRLTGAACSLARDIDLPVPEAARDARNALRSLPGFAGGFSLASALLVAAAPDRMAVYDRRAHNGLAQVGVAYRRQQGYGVYMQLVEQLRFEMGAQRGVHWTARDVDLALFMAGDGS